MGKYHVWFFGLLNAFVPAIHVCFGATEMQRVKVVLGPDRFRSKRASMSAADAVDGSSHRRASAMESVADR